MFKKVTTRQPRFVRTLLSVFCTTTLLLVGLAPVAQAATPFGSGECIQQGTGISGAVVRQGNYCLVAIKSTTGSASWDVPNGVIKIDFNVVGGGGGGGNFGGGGAGSFNETLNKSVAATSLNAANSIPVSVGAGGTGGYGTAGQYVGVNGSSSSFGTQSAAGGGGGGGGGSATITAPAITNGSGGGYFASQTGAAMGSLVNGANAGTEATTLQFRGGASKTIYATVAGSTRYWPAGGGGGGAGAVGGDVGWTSDGTAAGTDLLGGTGGIGVVSSLLNTASSTALAVGTVSGSDVYFAGGGGGGINNNGVGLRTNGYGLGGKGGGGYGASVLNANGSGKANSGGGGGGGRALTGGTNTSSQGGTGGSGVVLIRYVIPQVVNLTVLSVTNDPTALDVSWTAPTGTETITGYKMAYRLASGAWSSDSSFGPGTTSAQMSGLTGETAYEVRVTPTFASGDGVVSAVSETTSNLLDQTVDWNPTNVTAETTSRDLDPNSEAVSSASSPITYSVYDAGQTMCSVDPVTGVVTYAAAGTCVVRATAAQTATFKAATKDVTFTFVAPSSNKSKKYKKILFAANSAVLTKAAKIYLKDQAATLATHNSLVIRGYTATQFNSKSPTLFSRQLSKARATAVAKYLKSLGIKVSMTIRGKGSLNPASTSNLEKNRRVVITGK